jgi:hypothetical protein
MLAAIFVSVDATMLPPEGNAKNSSSRHESFLTSADTDRLSLEDVNVRQFRSLSDMFGMCYGSTPSVRT